MHLLAVLTLTKGQFNLVYNALSFVIAAMGASLVFLLHHVKSSAKPDSLHHLKSPDGGTG